MGRGPGGNQEEASSCPARCPLGVMLLGSSSHTAFLESSRPVSQEGTPRVKHIRQREMAGPGGGGLEWRGLCSLAPVPGKLARALVPGERPPRWCIFVKPCFYDAVLCARMQGVELFVLPLSAVFSKLVLLNVSYVLIERKHHLYVNNLCSLLTLLTLFFVVVVNLKGRKKFINLFTAKIGRWPVVARARS